MFLASNEFLVQLFLYEQFVQMHVQPHVQRPTHFLIQYCRHKQSLCHLTLFPSFWMKNTIVASSFSLLILLTQNGHYWIKLFLCEIPNTQIKTSTSSSLLFPIEKKSYLPVSNSCAIVAVFNAFECVLPPPLVSQTSTRWPSTSSKSPIGKERLFFNAFRSFLFVFQWQWRFLRGGVSDPSPNPPPIPGLGTSKRFQRNPLAELAIELPDSFSWRCFLWLQFAFDFWLGFDIRLVVAFETDEVPSRTATSLLQYCRIAIRSPTLGTNIINCSSVIWLTAWQTICKIKIIDIVHLGAVDEAMEKKHTLSR